MCSLEMEINGNSTPAVESGGVRAALKKLSFRGFNGRQNSKQLVDEADECDAVTACANRQCIANTATAKSCEVDDILPANEVCFTPIADMDSLAILAAMDEANRQLEANQKARSSVTPSPNRTMDRHSESSISDQRVSRQSSISSCRSNSSTGSGISSPSNDAFVTDDLWTTWKSIMDDWENFENKKTELKGIIRRGIPAHFRGTVWLFLAGASESPVKECYLSYLKAESPHSKLIRRDVGRTYPEHEMFKAKDGAGQESLFNVIKAYSVHDTEVGYCQGIGFIAGLLLMHMPEEDAFTTLVHVMQDYQLRDLYKPLMAQLGLFMYQFESMIKEYNPELFKHFQSQEFCVTLFASSWFLTLFTLTLPLTVACRLFDVFLSEGVSVVFRASLALLQLCETDLLATDMEGMLKLLQKDLPSRLEADAEPLFATMFSIKYSSRKMSRLEKQYTTFKTKESMDEAEIMKLKTENRLLRQRITCLESDMELPLDVAAQCLSTCYTDGSRAKQLSKVVETMRFQEVKANTMIKELKGRIRELEAANQQLTHEPNIDIETLQEQLIACKLREAEAIMLTKELERRVVELDKHFQRHGEISGSPDAKGKANRAKLLEINDELMLAQIREAGAASEMAELRQRITELETAKHINDRQVKRVTAENERLVEQEEGWKTRERELESHIKALERQISDMESRMKEDAMMSRIKDAETSQMVAEMKQRIAELEIQNQEMVTADQLNMPHHSAEAVTGHAIDSKIADLQDQILQLKMLRVTTISDDDDATSFDEFDDFDEVDVGKLRFEDSVTELSLTLCDDAKTVLDIPNEGDDVIVETNPVLDIPGDGGIIEGPTALVPSVIIPGDGGIIDGPTAIVPSVIIPGDGGIIDGSTAIVPSVIIPGDGGIIEGPTALVPSVIIPGDGGIIDGPTAIVPSVIIPGDGGIIDGSTAIVPSVIIPGDGGIIDGPTALVPSVIIPGASDVIVDANCWFVSNCDDDFDEPPQTDNVVNGLNGNSSLTVLQT